jgi:hypothetical protein
MSPLIAPRKALALERAETQCLSLAIAGIAIILLTVMLAVSSGGGSTCRHVVKENVLCALNDVPFDKIRDRIICMVSITHHCLFGLHEWWWWWWWW